LAAGKPQAASAASGGPDGWRLPWRIKVPERDELIAYAVATLAMGLVLGLAIGPGLGGADRILPIISPPVAAVPTLPQEEGEADLPTALPPLGAPAGSETSVIPAASPSPAPVVVAAAPATPAPVEVPPPAAEPPPAVAPPPPAPAPTPVPPPDDGGSDALTLKGTVLAQAGTGRAYSMADTSGNLLTVFSAEPADPGYVVSVPVEPLANGTFGEDGLRQAVNIRKRTSVKGMVSWVDPVTRILVLSNRGASLPLDASSVLDPQQPPPEPGAWVETELLIEEVPEVSASKLPARDAPGSRADSGPAEVPPAGEPAADDPADDPPVESLDPASLNLKIESLTPLGEQSETIELSGKVETVDPELGLITISVDSLGLLSGVVEVSLPPRFPADRVQPGRFYSATVRVLPDGSFRLTGFSPAFNRKAADDRSEAFGEQR
jgi:hypothetical protein